LMKNKQIERNRRQPKYGERGKCNQGEYKRCRKFRQVEEQEKKQKNKKKKVGARTFEPQKQQQQQLRTENTTQIPPQSYPMQLHHALADTRGRHCPVAGNFSVAERRRHGGRRLVERARGRLGRLLHENFRAPIVFHRV
jgi:hypothetical protein